MTATEAVAWATVKIVNPLFNKSASFAIGLAARVSVEVLEDTDDITGDLDQSLKDLAIRTMEVLGHRHGLRITVNNEIPGSCGLGEPEALSVATVLATAGAVSRKHGSINELKIDKYVKEQFFMIDDKLVNKKALLDVCSLGEFDRVYSSFHGGFSVCDNRKREVSRRGEMESMSAVVLMPESIEEVPVEELRLYRNESEAIWSRANRGDLYTAMKLNSLLYRETISKRFLKAGALTVTVSFPSIVGLTRDGEKTGELANAVKDQGKTLAVPVQNHAARVEARPKRIYKTREFLGLKGDSEYDFL